MMLCGLHTARYFMQTHVQILPLTQLTRFIFWAINYFFFCPDVKSKSPFQGAICPLTCPQQYPLSSNAFLKMTIPSKVWMYRASASLKFLRNCFSNMPQKRVIQTLFKSPIDAFLYIPMAVFGMLHKNLGELLLTKLI